MYLRAWAAKSLSKEPFKACASGNIGVSGICGSPPVSTKKGTKMSVGCRKRDYEKCETCTHSTAEPNSNCLVRCNLGRGVLRTATSWCETYKAINPYETLLAITKWSIQV